MYVCIISIATVMIIQLLKVCQANVILHISISDTTDGLLLSTYEGDEKYLVKQ